MIDNTDVVVNMFIKAQSNAEEVLRSTAKAVADADAQIAAAQKASVMSSGSASPVANATFATEQKAAAHDAALAMGDLSLAIRNGETDLAPYIERVQLSRQSLQTFADAETRARTEVGLTTTTLSKANKETEASATAWSGAASKMKLFELGTAGVIGITTDMAMNFQKSMEMVHTQAGAPQSEVDALSSKILDLSNTVATGPNALATSLYHAESAGYRMSAALDIVKASAEGANVGNADLESTTQAVIAVMSSQIGGVKNASEAMAYLNGIVGIGDMRMQGLTEALSTGTLPTFKTAGLSIRDFGAALAVLTDNATPPAEAATRLRMTVALLAAPSGAAAKALEAVGFSANDANAALAHRDELEQYGIHLSQLSADLRKPDGLLVALEDLQTHLKASGLTATEQTAVITRAFGGGRSSGAIQTLLEELDKLKSKYGDLGTAITKWEGDVSANQKTMQNQLKQAKASAEALSIALGQGLAPAETEVLNHLTPLLQGMTAWSKDHEDVTSTALKAAAVIGGLALVIKTGKGIWNLGTDAVTGYQKVLQLTGVTATTTTPEIAATGTAATAAGAEAEASAGGWLTLGGAMKAVVGIGVIYGGIAVANKLHTNDNAQAVRDVAKAYAEGKISADKYHEILSIMGSDTRALTEAQVAQDRAQLALNGHIGDGTVKTLAQTKAVHDQIAAYSKLSGLLGGVDALGIINGTASKGSPFPYSPKANDNKTSPLLLDLQKAVSAAQATVQHWADVVAYDRNVLHTDNTAHDAELKQARDKLASLEIEESRLTSVTTTVHDSLKTAKAPLDTLTQMENERAMLEAKVQALMAAGLPVSQAYQNDIRSLSAEITRIQKYITDLETPTTKSKDALAELAIAAEHGAEALGGKDNGKGGVGPEQGKGSASSGESGKETISYATPAGFVLLPAGALGNGGFGGQAGGGGTTIGGDHFGVPSSAQIGATHTAAEQAGYTAKEQTEQSIIDSLKHKAVLEGQDLSLTADQRKIDQDILQIKIDRKQTQIDLAKLEALQKSGTATPEQIAAAKATVTNDRNKTGEDKGQLEVDKTQAGLDTANAIVTASQNEISNANAISQAEIQVSTDVGGLQVQKLAAVVTAIQDGTAFIQASSALDTAKSTAATTSITDQTAIMAATYKLTADGIAGQRTIDQDLRNGDMQQMALDSKIAADQRAVDRVGIALAQATAARDAETSAEQIAIAQDGVTAARHKIDADTAADANQAALLQDGIAIDRAKLTLAGDEVDLQKLQATIANDTLSVLHGQTDYSKQIADVTGKIADDNGVIRQLTEKQASDQTAANVSAASYANQQASDARQQAIDQASLAMSQGNWGKALAVLSQQQETDNENLSTDQGSLSELTAMRQMASESLQLAQVGIDGQKAGLDHQKAMISLDQSLSDSQKTAAEDALQVQEDNLAVQDARLKLQEVQDSGGTLVDIAQANLAVNQAGYTLQEDQYKQGQDAITAINNGSNVAALQALVKTLQGLLRQQNLPIATSRRGGSTLRYGYGLTAASAGANRGTR
jgi:TP901 family phage tail tape measure protein